MIIASVNVYLHPAFLHKGSSIYYVHEIFGKFSYPEYPGNRITIVKKEKFRPEKKLEQVNFGNQNKKKKMKSKDHLFFLK